MRALFVYVLVATVEARRIPLALYETRSRAEEVVGSELETRLKQNGISVSDCDYFTIEQWQVGDWLGRDTMKTLTSYDRMLNRKELVRRGLEGKTETQRRGERFRRLMENK